MGIVTPITRSIVGQIASSVTEGFGGGLSPIFAAMLQSSLIPSKAKGDSTPTFTRASSATFVDFEGVVREVNSGEARFMGARRVENLLRYSEDFSNPAWSVTDVIVAGTEQLTFPASGDHIFQTLGASLAPGASVIGSVELKGVAGETVSLFLFTAESGLVGQTEITLTADWKRYTAAHDFAASEVSAPRLYIRRHNVNTVTTCNARKAQLEYATGRADLETPSEYVSRDVLSAPYHGAGVDGVKFFTTKNGNSVTDNVVTEATGAPIGASDFNADAGGPFGYVSEGASTNLALYSRDFTNAAWVKSNVTAAKDATGVDGSANGACTLTATANNGTILQTVTSASSDRVISCDVKRKTGTGTVEITVDGGTTWVDLTNDIGGSWVRVDATKAAVTNPQFGFRLGTSGDEVEADFFQLENGGFPTSRIATEGSTVTRAADVLTYDDVDNIQNAAGTAYCEASTLWGADPSENRAIERGASGRLLYNNASLTSNRSLSYDGTNQSASPLSGSSMEDGTLGMACTWGDNLTCYFDGAPDATPASYAGTMGSGDIGVGCSNVGGNQWNGTIRSVKIFNKELSADQVASL